MAPIHTDSEIVRTIMLEIKLIRENLELVRNRHEKPWHGL